MTVEVAEFEGLNILRLDLCGRRCAPETTQTPVGIQEHTVADRPRTTS
jgi:hypothetical protein